MNAETFRKVARTLGRKRTALPTLLVLLVDMTLACGVLLLAPSSNALQQACAVPLLTLVLLHSVLIVHECIHGTVLPRQRYNDWLGHLCGFVTLLPYETRRHDHLLHHKLVNHVDDPANARAIALFARLTTRALFVLDLLWRAWVPGLALHERLGLWRAAFGRDPSLPTARAERRAALAYVFGYAGVLSLLAACGSLALGLSVYFVAWWLLLMLEELVNLPHHLGLPVGTERLHAREQARAAHSCRPLPVWSSLVLLWFGSTHPAHHVWPSVPWYLLRRAQRLLVERGQAERGASEFEWSIRERRKPFSQVFQPYLRDQQTRTQRASEIEQQHSASADTP